MPNTGKNNPKLQVGITGVVNDGSTYEILEYIEPCKVKVVLRGGVQDYETIVRTDNLLRGKVKNKYLREVAGVGVIGTGDTTLQSAKTWGNMLSRVYRYKRHGRYSLCSVHPHWHYLSNFQQWYTEQVLEDGWSLDKDLLIKGNLQYGPETCVFLPHAINVFLCTYRKRRGEYPLGVSFSKVLGRFVAQVNLDGSQTYLGSFYKPEDAFYAYKAEKEMRARQLAAAWRGRIDDKAYDALMRYSVELDD
jgi:hypothetical protein